MPFEYDKHHIQNFEDVIRLTAQQKQSKLRNTIESRDDINGKFDHWDRMGAIEAQQKTGRFGKTVFNEIPHPRRRVILAEFQVHVPLDKGDIRRMVADPTNIYVRVMIAALNRKIDDRIILSATGNALSIDGDDVSTTVALPAGQTIVNGGVGLTQSKVDEAFEKLMNVDGVEEDDLWAIITQRQVRDLFAESGAKVVSRDFNINMPMINGKIMGMWGGFKWIVSNRILKSGTTRSCLFYSRPSIGFSFNKESLMLDIGVRRDLNNTLQLSMDFDGDAVRVEDELMVEVECTE